MVKREILNFIKDFLPDWNIKVKYISNEECEGASAEVDCEAKIMYINKKRFPSYGEVYQKCIILHEIGHLLSKDSNSSSKDEYKAHVTAMLLACDRDMDNIVEELINIITSWSMIGWNEDGGKWRSHILAAKRFLERFERDE